MTWTKKIINNKWIAYVPFAIILVYAIYMHRNIGVNMGDDLTIMTYYGQDIFEIIKGQYFGWSSRFIVSFLAILFAAYIPQMWRIVNIIVFVSIYYMLEKLFNSKNNLLISFIIVFMMILFPFVELGTAGWVATTTNYLWPFASLLCAFISIIYILLGKVKNKWCLLYEIPLLLYGCNLEQGALLTFGFMLVFIVYYLLQKKKIPKLFYIYFIISILSLIFIGTCPGNLSRYQSEMITWFPDFEQLGLGGKITLSLLNVCELLIGQSNYLFLTLLFSLMLLFVQRKQYVNMTISSILFGGALILPQSGLFVLAYHYQKYVKESPLIPSLNLFSKHYWLAVIIGIIYLISMLYLLYQTKDSKKFTLNSFLLPIMYLAGFLSLFMIGFSPTIYASGYRTAIFLLFLIIFIIILIFKKIIVEKNDTSSIICYMIILLIIKFKTFFYFIV